MPHAEQHEQNKVKNYLLLVILLAFVGVFFAVTMIKISNAAKKRAPEAVVKTEQLEKTSEEEAATSANQ